MTQQLADGVKFGTIRQAEGGEGVARHVEGDGLAEAGLARPSLQQLVGVRGIGQVLVH